MPPASPIITACSQATLIAALSNITAQLLSHYYRSTRQEPLVFSLADFARFIVFTILTAPPNYVWQSWLERKFPARPVLRKGHREPSQADEEVYEEIDLGAVEDGSLRQETGTAGSRQLSWRNTALKWFIDCITLGALFNTIAFLVLMGLMKGKVMSDVMNVVRKVSTSHFR